MKLFFPILCLLLISCTVVQQPYDSEVKQFDQTIQNFTITDNLNPITVRVNVIVLQNPKKDKSNFDLNNPEEKQLLVDYFEKINLVWSHFYQPDDLTGCYTGADFYKDAKIRFKFNYITILDEYAWNYRSSGADLEAKNYKNVLPDEQWYLTYLDNKLASDSSIPKGIFVYLPLDGKNFDKYYKSKSENYNLSGIEASQFPSVTNLSRTSSVLVPNRYLKYLMHRYQSPKNYQTIWENTRTWFISDAVGTAHELGHSLGLAHSNSYHGTNQCSFSLMSQNWQHARNYLQPTEILKAHQNLRESNLIQFVTDDSFLGNTFFIDKSTNWNKTQRFYSNLKLADNILLTISEPVIISPQASITFGKNSKIKFEGNGKFIYPNGKEFSNFVNKISQSIMHK